MNPDQKGDEEIGKGDFYGHDNPEADDAIYQYDTEKAETY